jgi:transcription initiation factor TFIID subunit 5
MSNTPPVNNTPPPTAAPAPLQQNSNDSPSPADIDKMVASYLQKKGYKATEAIFARESKGDTVSLEDVGESVKIELDTANEKEKVHVDQVMEDATTTSSSSQVPQPLEQTQQSGDSDVYDVSYKSLREWIENSLDWYKVKNGAQVEKTLSFFSINIL